jgi:hypothetical protein
LITEEAKLVLSEVNVSKRDTKMKVEDQMISERHESAVHDTLSGYEDLVLQHKRAAVPAGLGCQQDRRG